MKSIEQINMTWSARYLGKQEQERGIGLCGFDHRKDKKPVQVIGGTFHGWKVLITDEVMW